MIFQKKSHFSIIFLETLLGGARPGAGRKAQGEAKTEAITLRVSEAVKMKLRQEAEAAGKPIGRLIEEMLLEREAGK